MNKAPFIFITGFLFAVTCANGQAADTTAIHTDTLRTVAPVKKSIDASYIPPAAFVTYGVLSFYVKPLRSIDHYFYNDRQEDHPNFHTRLDNYLRYAPLALVATLQISGVKARDKPADVLGLLAVSQSISAGVILVTKSISGRWRPNMADKYSFPSGHAGGAFTNAEFLYYEYGHASIWYGIAGYAAAAGTGVLRIYNDKHWFSDVIAGAGIGILATKAGTIVYPAIKKLFNPKSKTSQSVLLPNFQNGSIGLYYAKVF